MSATTISPERIPAGTYNVDPSHSSVGFEVKHMGIATVRGQFRTFRGHARRDRRRALSSRAPSMSPASTRGTSSAMRT